MRNKEVFENDENFNNNNYKTICNPKEYNDDIDDILVKLGNLSETSDDKSFDSPIIFNRTKTFYGGYNTDAKHLFEDYLEKRKNNYAHLYKHRNNNKFSKINKTESFKNKIFSKKGIRTKSLINMKSNQSIKKKNSFYDKRIKRLGSDEMIPENRNNSYINFYMKNKQIKVFLYLK